VHFSPFEQKMGYERTSSLRGFFQIVCLSNFSEKPILKRVGGNFELLEILVQLLIKKKSVSQNNLPLQSKEAAVPINWT
jgi:hypothetical protein